MQQDKGTTAYVISIGGPQLCGPKSRLESVVHLGVWLSYMDLASWLAVAL